MRRSIDGGLTAQGVMETQPSFESLDAVQDQQRIPSATRQEVEISTSNLNLLFAIVCCRCRHVLSLRQPYEPVCGPGV